jgi:sulfur carrier protein
MTVLVNGEPREVEDIVTVAEIVRTFTDEERGVAVALDGEVVPRGEWATTLVTAGRSLEVLRAVQGG